jgi:transposase InsO family protein
MFTVLIDLNGRRVIGYTMANPLKASLAIDAMSMALDHRRPASGSWRD